MDTNNISDELMEKAKACQSVEELLELAKNEGYDLSDEELEAIAGGESWYCPQDGIITCPEACSVGKKTINPITKLM